MEIKDNDVVILTRKGSRMTPRICIATVIGNSTYLTTINCAQNGHATLSWYLMDYEVNCIYRAKTIANIALLKREYMVTGFDPSKEEWLEKVYSGMPEYTMSQLEKLVGHPFKLIE